MKRQLRKFFKIRDRQTFGYHKYPFNFLRKKPDFVIIGTQKAATTSLHSFLGDHPQLMSASIKETHYFNMNYDRGNQYYLSCFPIKKGNCLTFESTPGYIDHPLVPKLLHASNPKAKLIVTLREPVSRAFSHFNFVQSYNQKEKEVSFEQGLELEKTRIENALATLESDPYNSARDLSNYGYRRKGLYAEHIKKWLEYFPLNQFHFIEFPDVISNNKSAYDELFDFLNVEPVELGYEVRKNVTKYSSGINHKTEMELKEYYKPHNKNLFELIKKNYPW